MAKKLTKSNDKMVGGVAAGIAEYLSIDPIIIRLIFLVGLFIETWVLLLYLALIVLVPEAAKGKDVRKDVTPPNKNVQLSIGIGVIGLGVSLIIRNIFPEVFSVIESTFPGLILITFGLFIIFYFTRRESD